MSNSSRKDTKESSRMALEAMGPKKMAAKMAEIYDVIVRCHKKDMGDLSLSEIQKEYEDFYSKRIDLNRVSARVYDLVQAHRVVRSESLRPCFVTGRMIHPVFAKPQQAALPGVGG
jgi:hypothetical protein